MLYFQNFVLSIFVCVFACVACKVFIMMTFLVVSAAVFLCPLAIYSPCITSNLPPKPSLVGHRGAPMVSVTFILRHSFLLLERVIAHVYIGVPIKFLFQLFFHAGAELQDDFNIFFFRINLTCHRMNHLLYFLNPFRIMMIMASFPGCKLPTWRNVFHQHVSLLINVGTFIKHQQFIDAVITVKTYRVITKHVVLIHKYNLNGGQSAIQTQSIEFHWHGRWRTCFDI